MEIEEVFCSSDSQTSDRREDWPEDFWKAFQGVPEDLERPDQVRQWRESIDPCSTSG